MKYVAHADILHGKLHIDDRERRWLQEAVLAWPEGPVTITVERQVATRSARANAYYWGVVVKALSDYTGSTPDEMHDVLKIQFLAKDVAIARANGEVIAEFVIGGSTVGLTSIEFYDYVERIRQWAFEELDVDIPPPDPEWRDHVQAQRAAAAAEGVA